MKQRQHTEEKFSLSLTMNKNPLLIFGIYEGPRHMPAAPQGSSMLSHHLAQMSGNSNFYGHEGITWCGVLPVSLDVIDAAQKYWMGSNKFRPCMIL